MQPFGERKTFLLTDIQASTRILESVGDEAFASLLASHHQILRSCFAEFGGHEINTEGDSFLVAFDDPASAIAASVAVQLQLRAHDWPPNAEIKVRIGIHRGEVRRGGDDYTGLALHQAARIMSAGHGGQIVASTDALVDDLPEGVHAKPMGRHRLRDLGLPVELVQICHADLESDFPALRTLERVTHNLPIQPSSFLGRSDDLMLGAKLLSSTRILTIGGPGGTGKTRLAYQLAASQFHEYPDGVWTLELASVTDPDEVPNLLLTAIGLREDPTRTGEEVVAAHLRTLKAMVILDNCEHLLGACARLVNQLTEGTHLLTLLATSREPLGVAGERIWSIAPLRLPTASETSVESLASADAVRLFCERASEARVDFTLTADNAAHVAHICERLDGMPLAIELAAARVRSMSLADLDDRLDSSLDLAASQNSGRTPRQASLRGAIDWSHDLLTDDEATLFRRLSVFHGGFTASSVDVIAAYDFDSSESVLESLVDKSLVVFNPDDDSGGRYGLLQLIHSFALERLGACGEVSELAERHAVHYSRVAHELSESGDTAEVLHEMEAEHANFRTAIAFLAEAPDPNSHGQLICDLASFWDLRGHWRLARHEIQSFLDRPESHPGLRAVCLGMLGRVNFVLGDYDQARQSYRASLGLLQQLDAPHLMGVNLGSLANVEMTVGDYGQAHTLFEEAVALAKQTGDRRREATWTGDLGTMAYSRSDYDEAQRRYQRALDISRELGDLHLEGTWLSNLANVASEVREYGVASDRFTEALDVARRLGDARVECYCIGSLGNIAFEIGDSDSAATDLGEALRIAQALGDRQMEGYWLGGLGVVCVHTDRIAEGRSHLDTALEIARELQDRTRQASWLIALGDAALRSGDLASSAGHLSGALQLLLDAESEDVEALEVCAALLSEAGRTQEALALVSSADALLSQTGRSVPAQKRVDEIRNASPGSQSQPPQPDWASAARDAMTKLAGLAVSGD